jgi:hypothetical protein
MMMVMMMVALMYTSRVGGNEFSELTELVVPMAMIGRHFYLFYFLFFKIGVYKMRIDRV